MAGDGAQGRRPTVADLRRVTQPDEVLGRDVEHWTAGLYLRRLSPFVTWGLVRLGLSANSVTWLMVATGVLAGAALLVEGVGGALLAVLLGQLQMLWDCCDGEVARWNRTQSAVGVFLDRVGHHAAEISIAVCLGLRAAGLGPLPGQDDPMGATALTVGTALAGLLVLNRALNDMVHASRAVAGLPPLAARARDVAAPTHRGLAAARTAAGVVPVHRMLHSVELTLLVLVAAVLDAVTDERATPVLLVALAVGAALTVVGHTAAILGSRRLAP